MIKDAHLPQNGCASFCYICCEIRDEYIVLELSKDEFKDFDKENIIRYKENRLDYQVLINKNNYKNKYKKYIKNITTLDDIMLLYINTNIKNRWYDYINSYFNIRINII